MSTVLRPMFWVGCIVCFHVLGFAQGEVSFSNVGGGLVAPVSVNGRFAGPDFLAQLQLADGTDVGQPAPFLAAGFFSGGVRRIPGKPPGSTVTLKIAVLSKESGEILATSNEFTIRLGGGLLLEPNVLVGLEPFDTAGFPTFYRSFRWTLNFEGNWICDFPGRRSSLEAFHPCFCQDAPVPDLSDAEANLPECDPDFEPGKIDYTLEDSSLTLRWMRFGFRMFASETLDRQDAQLVYGSNDHSGIAELYVRLPSDTKFFWLEPL